MEVLHNNKKYIITNTAIREVKPGAKPQKLFGKLHKALAATNPQLGDNILWDTYYLPQQNRFYSKKSKVQPYTQHLALRQIQPPPGHVFNPATNRIISEDKAKKLKNFEVKDGHLEFASDKFIVPKHKQFFKSVLRQYYVPANKRTEKDIPTFRDENRATAVGILEASYSLWKGLKVFGILIVQMKRETDDGPLIERFYLSSVGTANAISIVHKKDCGKAYGVIMDRIQVNFDNFIVRGSSWALAKIVGLELHISKYKPLG